MYSKYDKVRIIKIIVKRGVLSMENVMWGLFYIIGAVLITYLLVKVFFRKSFDTKIIMYSLITLSILFIIYFTWGTFT